MGKGREKEGRSGDIRAMRSGKGSMRTGKKERGRRRREGGGVFLGEGKRRDVGKNKCWWR